MFFFVRNVKAVKEAYIDRGSGVLDFIPTLNLVHPRHFRSQCRGGLMPSANSVANTVSFAQHAEAIELHIRRV